MGIDIYLKWEGMLPEEKRGQITGFDTTKGDVRYLREAYHGEPYATKYFVKEAFTSKTSQAKIKAATLKKRLPKAIKMAIEREKVVYGGVITKKDPVVQSYVNFAKLAEMKEKKSGEPCTVVASY